MNSRHCPSDISLVVKAAAHSLADSCTVLLHAKVAAAAAHGCECTTTAQLQSSRLRGLITSFLAWPACEEGVAIAPGALMTMPFLL
jgi:hypothetical protein